MSSSGVQIPLKSTTNSTISSASVTKPTPNTAACSVLPTGVNREATISYGDKGKVASVVAWFECIATIDDVVHGSGWYYIGCGVCHTKAVKGATTLMCKKCGKSEIVGVPQYLSKISVYDHSEHAVFVLLGDAGQELTGKKASELVESYYEANESVGDDVLVPVPQALVGTIGQTRKFIVKVSTNNLTGQTRVLTVTKVLPLEVAEVEGGLGENVDHGAEDGKEDPPAEAVKRMSDGVESAGVKRAKCG
ncbi:unnamed protein product [Eruca vesicaria subsp. sativa]|uniref:Replication factor A C-terminal domain-containing protein n=1 Tax=Eruca vesicaria subsp. sativa TaxID=29727 RepID=A0ABC8JY05_ERUVS|nr:unnamed protein product [Eruca vesicaria subsp. sativa]